MKVRDKMNLLSSILEIAIITLILMAVFTVAKQFVSDQYTPFQWKIVTVFYVVIIASLTAFFQLSKHKKHNKQLLLEIKMLKRMEEELREKVTELTHFKDLVVWWEKRIDDMQNEIKIIKGELSRHKQCE